MKQTRGQGRIEPVVIGVTGHRDIFCGTEGDPEDSVAIKERVKSSLEEIASAYDDVIMLNALAQGADMLCAEAALEVGIPIHAVLPCEKEKYLLSFDSLQGRNAEADKRRFNDLLNRCERVFVAPDFECLSEDFKKKHFDSAESYEYRRLGVYIAENSNFILALWDGLEPTTEYGCGTAEVVQFALLRNYSGGRESARVQNDCVVIKINCRRKKSSAKSATSENRAEEITVKYLTRNADNSGYVESDCRPKDLIRKKSGE